MKAPTVSCRNVGNCIQVSICWRDGTSVVTSAAMGLSDARAFMTELSDAIATAAEADRCKALEAAGQQRISL